MTRSTDRRGFVLAGMTPSTSNLGVHALLAATVMGARRVAPDAPLTVLDHQAGPARRIPLDVMRDGPVTTRIGATASLKAWSSTSVYRLGLENLLRLRRSDLARAIHGAAAVLDASGGDSFADHYGVRRFASIVGPKIAALQSNTRLVLLPQTYGPFEHGVSRRTARRIVRRADESWARDPQSFADLRELVGDDHFDPERHREGVDMAFAIEAQMPTDLPDDVVAMLERAHGDEPLVGVNASGLLWDNDAGESFGFALDYAATVQRLVTELLDRGARVLMVPHLAHSHGIIESDLHAGSQVLAAHDAAVGEQRLAAVPVGLSVDEVKGVLSRLDWFVGTRMHSTIGALGGGVPSAALAYSKKTLGVFETCAMGDQVADARLHDADTALGIIIDSYDHRDELRQRLAGVIGDVRERALRQVDEIVERAVGGR